MNTTRNAKYWVFWSKCRRALIENGYSPERADAMRHELQRQAIGVAKSSTRLTNPEFDAVLAKFESYANGGDLDAQLRPEAERARRITRLNARMRVFRDNLGLRTGLESAYIDGIARNLFKTDANLTEGQLNVLEGVVLRRLRQKHSPERVAEITAAAEEHANKTEATIHDARPPATIQEEDDGNPF